MRLGSALRALPITLLMAGTPVLAGPAASAAPGVFTVYLSPTGSDGNDGASPQSALATVDRAQAVLDEARPATDVEVRFAPGTYVQSKPSQRWRFFVPGHSVSFLPAGYRPGHPTPMSKRPVFHGPDTPAWWLQVNLPDGAPGGDTDLRFHDLVTEHYTAGGMTIAGPTTTNADGITVPSGAGLDHNVISGMVFRDGGSLHVPAAGGFAGLDLVNSSDNVITGNQFVRLQNAGDDGNMHGVYLAHGSSRNVVSGNEFTDISNDPMRVRNDSDGNDVHDNVFLRAGRDGFFTDWFCDVTCVAANPGHGRECSSQGNVFHDNVLVSGRAGTPIPTFAFFVGGNDYPGEQGCGNGGRQRITAFSNHGPGATSSQGDPGTAPRP